MIEATSLCKIFRSSAGDVNAVTSASISISRGHFVLIRGRSGSGKTTLLNLLGGLDRPTSGTVTIDGNDLNGMNGRQRDLWRREKVAYVFQALALLPGLTALENVELPLRIAGVEPRTASQRARDQLEIVGLGPRTHHKVFELSGGEQQRVAISRALVKKPAVLFADEPTGELDQKSGATVMQLLQSAVQERHMTAVVTSHDNDVASYADMSYAMVDGRPQLVQSLVEGAE
jgi:ABC-type lipoprotein export system ATPase subunit